MKCWLLQCEIWLNHKQNKSLTFLNAHQIIRQQTMAYFSSLCLFLCVSSLFLLSSSSAIPSHSIHSQPNALLFDKVKIVEKHVSSGCLQKTCHFNPLCHGSTRLLLVSLWNWEALQITLYGILQILLSKQISKSSQQGKSFTFFP